MSDITVASLFAGCGGSSCGYRMAGFRVLFANEFVPEARLSYALNAADYTKLDGRDVRTLTGKDMPYGVDVLDGSPPCSSFSTAGKRERGWREVKKYGVGGNLKQRTDDLFDEYLRLVDEVRPKVFVAENVRGLAIGKCRGYLSAIFSKAESLGYIVEARVLDAQYLGVPQRRKRTIIIGRRSDFKQPVQWPKLQPIVTLKQALKDVPLPSCEEEAGPSIESYAIGQEWKRMGRPGTQSERYFSLVRPSWDEPCPTITATTSATGAAGVAHPSECRKFSIPELRRICGFPDDFKLHGTYQQRAERLGRAVPPPMMAAVANAVRQILQSELIL